MKFLQTTAICAATALIAVPAIAEDKILSDVEVKADLSAYDKSNALEFWPTLDRDLGKAIAERVQIDDEADAPRLRVEINKVAIDGDTFLPDSGEFNELEGTVVVFADSSTDGADKDGDEEEATGSYALRLSARSAGGEAPEGWVYMPPSKEDFYTAMVDAYAEEVVERLD